MQASTFEIPELTATSVDEIPLPDVIPPLDVTGTTLGIDAAVQRSPSTGRFMHDFQAQAYADYARNMFQAEPGAQIRVGDVVQLNDSGRVTLADHTNSSQRCPTKFQIYERGSERMVQMMKESLDGIRVETTWQESLSAMCSRYSIPVPEVNLTSTLEMREYFLAKINEGRPLKFTSRLFKNTSHLSMLGSFDPCRGYFAACIALALHLAGAEVSDTDSNRLRSMYKDVLSINIFYKESLNGAS